MRALLLTLAAIAALTTALTTQPAAACPVEAPHSRPAVEEARQRVRAAPDRPGRWMRFAEALLAADDPAPARACAEAIIERWPTAMRARVLAARAALLMGDPAAADSLLAPVRAAGPRVAQLEAAQLEAARLGVDGRAAGGQPPADQWVIAASASAHYDDRAAQVSGPVEALSADDPAATRMALAAAAERVGPSQRWGVAAGRTVHVAAGDVGPLDRTHLGVHSQWRPGTLALRAAASGSLAGRAGEPYTVGGAVGVSWRPGAFAAELDAGAGWLASPARAGPAAWLGWVVGRLGARVTLGPAAIDLRGVGRARGPDAAMIDAGLEIEPSVGFGPLHLGGIAHAGRRWLTDRAAGTLGVGGQVGGRFGRFTVGLDALWQRVSAADFGGPALDRRVLGGRVGARW